MKRVKPGLIASTMSALILVVCRPSGSDDADASAGGTAETTRAGPQCGDGTVDPGEECDEGESGNNGLYGGCTGLCHLAPHCGDGVHQPDEEQCDFNAPGATHHCHEDCTQDPFCGDSIIQKGEQCDLGGSNSDDRYSDCSLSCEIPNCGDGVVQGGPEECDDQNDVSTDDCIWCQSARCGDRYVQMGVEECDKGSGNDDAGECTTTCELARCGDGLVEKGSEVCDDGNSITTDDCVMCRRARCGDGFVHQSYELCDDGDGSVSCSDNEECVQGFCEPGGSRCNSDDPHPTEETCDTKCQVQPPAGTRPLT